MKKKIAVPMQALKNIFKSDETKFIIFTGMKVSGISLGINVFVSFCLLEIMRLNHVFFKANGFPDLGEDTVFYDYITKEALNNIPILFSFHVFLFFIGTYIGWLILRPFRTIGDYCENVISNPNLIYTVEEFNTYKLLTRFSEFFFEFVREARRKGEITTNSIPPQYSKIHQPVSDRIFMLHFGILLVIVSICTSLFVIENTSEIFNNMIELADKTLSNDKIVSKFLGEQDFVLDDMVNMSISLTAILYIILGFHLYAKVSGAAFGIFSTMRAFMKGNHFSRVHLVGYAHVRDSTRKLNKFLDYAQNNFDKDKGKELK
jgi:hypothetical protein